MKPHPYEPKFGLVVTISLEFLAFDETSCGYRIASVWHPLLESKESWVTRRRSWISAK
jgi:hypothetical protein